MLKQRRLPEPIRSTFKCPKILNAETYRFYIVIEVCRTQTGTTKRIPLDGPLNTFSRSWILVAASSPCNRSRRSHVNFHHIPDRWELFLPPNPDRLYNLKLGIGGVTFVTLYYLYAINLQHVSNMNSLFLSCTRKELK